VTPRLREGTAPAVLAHDTRHGTAYAATLSAFLAAGGEVAAAARELSVHPNTCRYRLARAQQVFGFDLEDPDQRLVLRIGLRLAGLRLAGSGPAGSGPVGSGPVGSGPVGSGPVGSGPVGSGPVGSGRVAAAPH
jgi:hypothetical protein